MEMIIVMILVAIALTAAFNTMSSVRRSDADTRYATAASTIWRGIGSWRLDNKGAFPTTAQIGAGSATFANLAGARYVRTWPENPATQAPLALTPSSLATAPSTSTPNTVQYASTPTTAWLAAYGHDGRILFMRGATRGTTPTAPVG